MAKSVKVVTGKVRFSYAHVFQPAETLNGDLKYSVSLIIDKNDKETIAAINKAFEEVKAENQDIFKGVSAKLIKGGLRDGDEERPNDAAYANSYFVNANSKLKPALFDENSQAIIDPSELVSGDYGRASVNFFAYNAGGSKGVGCGLNSLMKLESGEKLGGAVASAADFA